MKRAATTTILASGIGLCLALRGLCAAGADPSQPANLHFAAGPTNASDLVMSALHAQRPGLGVGIPVRAGPMVPDADKDTLSPALVIYDLSLADVAKGAGLEAAQPSAGVEQYLYYAVDASGKTVATVSVIVGPGRIGGRTGGNFGRTGPRVGMTETGMEQYGRAFEKLASLDAVRAGTFEVRLIRINGQTGRNGFRALWLKADGGKSDLIYPVTPPNPDTPPPAGLQFDTLYTADAFLKAFRSSAATGK